MQHVNIGCEDDFMVFNNAEAAALFVGSWWTFISWSGKINNGVKAVDGKKLSRKLSALDL